jgi:hypothetical protein
MSNSQRKKEAAKAHNMAFMEKQAYTEDRIRDPEKYRVKRDKRAERSLMMLSAMRMSISSTAFDDRHFR